MIKAIEFIGVGCGVVGSFLVARGINDVGFVLFLLSSICLSYTAFKQNNFNLVMLQLVYAVCNILGIANYIFGV